MHLRSGRAHRHRNVPGAFQGRSSKLYDFVARRLMRGVYRRFAADLAGATPEYARAVLVACREAARQLAEEA